MHDHQLLIPHRHTNYGLATGGQNEPGRMRCWQQDMHNLWSILQLNSTRSTFFTLSRAFIIKEEVGDFLYWRNQLLLQQRLKQCEKDPPGLLWARWGAPTNTMWFQALVFMWERWMINLLCNGPGEASQKPGARQQLLSALLVEQRGSVDPLVGQPLCHAFSLQLCFDEICLEEKLIKFEISLT